jgi:hydrogenase maturation factor
MGKFSEYQRQVGKQNLSQDETLSRYLSGADELWAAIEGLSEAGLDLARAPDKWTIRQYVHHIVADDNAATTCIQAAICQPGREPR